ncbi:MAG: DinB family protein [Planctomycetota bacterium]|nr:DinB family protein [Planctomycetota bacterium]
MDKDTLIAGLEFSRGRLLGILDTIETSGQDVPTVLAWRPGPGRAHIGWQAMHCAATHDRYLNMGLLQQLVKDEKLVADFAGGSKPSDTNVPSLALIREKLALYYEPFKAYVAAQNADSFQRLMGAPGGKQRTMGESILLITWHEAHHQGQIHLTWNLYKGAHGMA